MCDFSEERRDENMGDSLQIFHFYKDERDKREALTLELDSQRQEIQQLKEKLAMNGAGALSQPDEIGMSDYRFKYIMDLKDANEALRFESVCSLMPLWITKKAKRR